MMTEVIAVTGEPSAPKQFVLVTRAVIDRSAMMDSIAWSTRVAEHVTKVTGVGMTVAGNDRPHASAQDALNGTLRFRSTVDDR